MTDRELLMQAVAALLTDDSNEHIKVVEAIDAHLAQPEQQSEYERGFIDGQEKVDVFRQRLAALETKQRQPLTDEEEREKFNQWFNSFYLTNWQEQNGSEVLARWVAWKARAKLAVTPQRKPLADEEIETFAEQIGIDFDGCIAFARTIEAAHNIKEKK